MMNTNLNMNLNTLTVVNTLCIRTTREGFGLFREIVNLLKTKTNELLKPSD